MAESIGGPSVPASDGLAPRTPLETLATWYAVKGANDTFFRAEAPAEAVGGRVSYILEHDIIETLVYPNRDTGLPWSVEVVDEAGKTLITDRDAWETFNREARTVTCLRPRFPLHLGAAVFTRPCLARATLARYMREEGIRTIAESDDNYFASERFNLFLRHQGHNDVHTETHAKAFASMDANVFSTSWLRDRYWLEYRTRFGERGRHLVGMPELHVCRNHIPGDAWPVRDEGDGRLRVAFMGSPSHVWDVNLAFAAFNNVHGLDEVETVMIGYHPGDPDPDLPTTYTDEEGVERSVYSEKAQRNIRLWDGVVDRHIPWIDPGEYHRASLPVDIGLAPLRVDDFTLGKSDSKMLEYAINGAAIVCSRMPVFSSAGWVDGVNCLMAGSPVEMAEAVVRLVDDPGLRAGLVEAAQDMVRNERNETVMASEWKAAIQG